MDQYEAIAVLSQFVSDELENRERCLYVKSEYVDNARRAQRAVEVIRKKVEESKCLAVCNLQA